MLPRILLAAGLASVAANSLAGGGHFRTPAKIFACTIPDEQVSLVGNVKDASGKPVAGAKVFLPLRRSRNPSVNWTAKTETDAHGRFTLEFPKRWLKPGPFVPLRTVWVHAAGYRLGASYAKLALENGDSAPIEVTLEAETDTSFVIVGPDKNPLAGEIVEPFFAVMDRLPADVRALLRVRTDMSGRAKMPMVARDSLSEIQIISAEFGVQRQELEVVGPAESVVHIRGSGRIEGTIVCADPKLAAGITLVFWGIREGELLDTAGFAETVTDELGRFAIPAAASGAYWVSGYVDPSLPFRPDVPRVCRVTARETSRLTIELKPAARVRGQVRVLGAHDLVDGALVSIFSGAGQMGELTHSGADGAFEAFVLPGDVRQKIEILPKDFMEIPRKSGLERIPVVESDDVVELPSIEVLRASRVEGRLLDENGKPVREARLRCKAGTVVFDTSAQTDMEGKFTMRIPNGVEFEYCVFDRFAPGVDRRVDVASEQPLVLRIKE